MWLPHQRLRLAQERAALEYYLGNFAFYNLPSDTYVFGSWASNMNRVYSVRLDLPPAYPDEVPHTYVTSPSPLRGYRQPIESYGSSHAMHTWKTDRPGWTKICIVRPEDWSAEYSVVKVLRKAMLWITAYECHLDDGRPIADFLK